MQCWLAGASDADVGLAGAPRCLGRVSKSQVSTGRDTHEAVEAHDGSNAGREADGEDEDEGRLLFPGY